MKHVAQYSPLLNDGVKNDIARAPAQSSIKERFQRENLPLSELPQFLNGTYTLEKPVYTVWGACEDVSVLEKLRSGEYKINNLFVIDESHARLLDIGGVKLRLLGLGGAVVMHKLFDNGEGRTTIAGGQGTMWTTLLQIGELIDTANRVYDPTETRVFVTHASPAREGLLNQLAVALKADFSISAGLHFRYGSSYNEFSVNPTLDHYRGKLAASKASFNDVWETVKSEVEPAVAENESQQRLLNNALDLVSKMPSVANGGNPFGGSNIGPQGGVVDESAFKNMWNFNLADAAFGWLLLDIDQGRIGTEMKAQGFNFSHRAGKPTQRPAQPAQAAQPGQAAATAPASAPTPSNAPTPSGPPAATASAPTPTNAPPRAPGPHTARPPVATPQQVSSPATAKPAASPQPAATPTNGTAPPTPAKAEEKASAPVTNDTPPKQPEPPKSQSIFIPPINGVDDEADVRQIFSEEDQKKLVKLERTSKGFWIAHFNSPEEMQEVLKRSPASDGKYSSLRISEFKTRPARGGFQAGTWGSSRNPSGQQSGYRSGQSDSEGGRSGRGGRGGRGRGMGERGGRGGRGGAGRGPPTGSTPGGESQG